MELSRHCLNKDLSHFYVSRWTLRCLSSLKKVLYLSIAWKYALFYVLACFGCSLENRMSVSKYLNWTRHTKTAGIAEYIDLEGSPALTMSSKTTILLWMLHTELVAYASFTPLNVSLIEGSVSLRCQSCRLRKARGPQEKAVLCTSEDECQGLWLPEKKTDHESCICDNFLGTNFTPYHKPPFMHMKSIATTPLICNEYGLTNLIQRRNFDTIATTIVDSRNGSKMHNSLHLLPRNWDQ